MSNTAAYASYDPELGGSKSESLHSFAEKTVRLGFIRKVLGAWRTQAWGAPIGRVPGANV
jgi:hypothetical protein